MNSFRFHYYYLNNIINFNNPFLLPSFSLLLTTRKGGESMFSSFKLFSLIHAAHHDEFYLFCKI